MSAFRSRPCAAAAMRRFGLVLAAVAPAIFARAAAADNPAPVAKIAAAAQEYERSAKASAGLSVVDLRTGKTVLAVRDGELFAPASNQKALTGAFALARLGGDFEFVTRVCLAGKDLWVLGSGDPTLGDPVLAAEANATIYAELDRWAGAVARALPDGIEGDLVVCRALRPDQKTPQESFRHPDWPRSQYHTWYCAPAAALNFNDNCIDVTFRLAGGKVVPSLSPSSRYIQVANRIQPGAKHLWSAALGRGDSVLTLTGTATASHPDPQNVPVNDPLLFLGRVLADRLARAGVKLSGKITVADAPPADSESWRELARTATPIGAVLRRANKRSLNMAAECLFLRAGDGTWEGSARLMSATLQKDCGVEAGALAIRDGSGLSHEDRVTPAAMTRVLAATARRRDAKPYLESLPFSGIDGTMEHRLVAAPYRGRLLAKTGYIAGVSCLSGYVLDREYRPTLTFSILCNQASGARPAKELQDSVCSVLVDWIDAKPEK